MNEIVIIVRGDNVCAVLSTDPDCVVHVLDFSNAEAESEQTVEQYEHDIQHFESVMTYVY